MSKLVRKGNDSVGLIKSDRIRALAERAKKVSGQHHPANNLQICLVCDTTGSMHQVFQKAYGAVREIINELGKQTRSQMAFIAYKNHGDENYFDNERAFAATPWTDDPAEIERLMQKVQNGGGGDGLTVLEDVLHTLNEDYTWDPGSPKVVVLIGDMPPHGVVDSINRCPRKIDYIEQVNRLKNQGVKIYTVYCDTDSEFTGSERKRKIKEFFTQTAEATSGICLSLEDVQLLITMLLGICMKETNQLDEYVKKLSSQRQLSSGERKFLGQLGSGN